MADPHLRGRQVKAQLGAVRKASAGYQDMQRLLDRYAIERFLYRLGRSLYADQLILKGAMLLAVYIPDACRSTRDADFLGFGRFTPQALKQMLAEICADEQDDGLTFDVSGTIVQAAGAERAGTRRPCRPTARSGRQVARLRGQAGADIPYRPCGHNERYRTGVSEGSNDLWGQRSLSNHSASGSPWTSATCTRLVAPGGRSSYVRRATGTASTSLSRCWTPGTPSPGPIPSASTRFLPPECLLSQPAPAKARPFHAVPPQNGSYSRGITAELCALLPFRRILEHSVPRV